MNEIVLGTYRRIGEFSSVFEALSNANLLAVDTAPNYCGGTSEKVVGRALRKHAVPVLTKVGYTSGDTAALLALANGSRHCLSREYVLARVESSKQVICASDNKLECVFIHNPEHILETDHHNPISAFEDALAGLKDAYDSGYLNSFGIATWTISPYSDSGHRVFESIDRLGLTDLLKYWMHPISILRREIVAEALIEKRYPVPGNWRLLASAPFAGGESFRILGRRFSSIFDGDSNATSQALCLVDSVGAVPVCGIGTKEHAITLLNTLSRIIPGKDHAERFVRMVDEL